MKRAFVLGCCFLVAGCAGAPVAPVAVVASPEFMHRQFITTSQLQIGLTRAEVAGILGKQVVVGYALADDATEQYKPITVGNPQRSQTLTKNNKTFTIDYYLVGIKIADDKISDDELLPLVFEQDRLVGIGWDFFNKSVKGQ